MDIAINYINEILTLPVTKLLAGFSGSIVIILLVLRYVLDRRLHSRNVSREDIKLLHDMSFDFPSTEKNTVDRLYAEEVFKYVYGLDVSFEEVVVLLSSPCPKKAIYEYKRHRYFLKLNEKKIRFKYKDPLEVIAPIYFLFEPVRKLTKNMQFVFLISTTLMMYFLGVYVMAYSIEGYAANNLLISIFFIPCGVLIMFISLFLGNRIISYAVYSSSQKGTETYLPIEISAKGV
ncbi:hypothetical protein GNP79_19445 [Aliivibrio fischeri]|uniref:Uncharacterized protein n=1 Tax=Aliivibrio fischeri TaxID=668 RepID=A0A6N3YVG6_ALIFS|nr:hypothetical protein [Aliivibrio fischeri]MUK45682.1 hypothetical protein [Aliivibrio fischeri]MUK82954.1 hypothetical protein [Aliivibrio fischeri]MUK86761.1 hypothetical protein [Aliivibrio fischeri]